MKKLENFILLFFLLLLFGCKIKTKEKFIYSKKLAEIQVFELNEKFFDNSKKIKKMDSIIFNKFNNGVKILKYPKSNKVLINFLNKNLKNLDKIFYYGATENKKNTFFLFSFEDKNYEFPFAQKGFLAIKNNAKYTIIKVYHEVMESSEFFRSFYSNNYLLLWYTYDESYDIVEEGVEKKTDEKFCILKIKEDGSVVILNEEEGRKILKKEFGKYLKSVNH